MNNDINGRVNQLQTVYYIAMEFLYKLKCLKCSSQFLLYTGCVQANMRPTNNWLQSQQDLHLGTN